LINFAFYFVDLFQSHVFIFILYLSQSEEFINFEDGLKIVKEIKRRYFAVDGCGLICDFYLAGNKLSLVLLVHAYHIYIVVDSRDIADCTVNVLHLVLVDYFFVIEN
jgi:hypothetical protein